MRALSSVALLGVAVAWVGLRAEPTGQERPDPVVVDADHYSVVLENDAVRAVRIRYGAGETSVMHYHPAHCGVYMTDATVRFELPDGQTAEASGKAGDVLCVDGGLHKPSNAGDEPMEFVAFELKGRETLSSQ